MGLVLTGSVTGLAFPDWLLRLQVLRFRPLAMNQQAWANIPRPTGVLGRVYDILSSRYFDHFIVVCIIANIAVIAATSYNEPFSTTVVLDLLNKSFTTVFLVEAVSKLMVMGAYQYCTDNWNKLDLTIALFSFPDLFSRPRSFDTASGLSVGVESVRIFRVCRIFKLLRVRKHDISLSSANEHE